MKIVRSVQVSEIVGSVAADMLSMIGPDHPKMTNAERERKAAQRHIVELFAEQLREAWPTVHGPQFGDAEVVQETDNDELGHCFVSRGPNGAWETDHCVRCYCERYEGDGYYGGCRP